MEVIAMKEYSTFHWSLELEPLHFWGIEGDYSSAGDTVSVF